MIEYLREPTGPGVRNDSGVYQGWEVGPYYDPILSKLVTVDETRDGARRKMLQALDEYVVHGIHTTIEVHEKILASEAFVRGQTDTGFLDQHIDGWFDGSDGLADDAFVAAALAEALAEDRQPLSNQTARATTPWQQIGDWEIGGRR